MTWVSVFAKLQNHSSKNLSFSIVASPLIFVSPGFAVFLAKIFTLSVTINWPENSARHTASSERYHKWFSTAFLTWQQCRFNDQLIHIFVGQSKEIDFVLELQQQGHGIPLYKERQKTLQIDGSEFLFSCKIEGYHKWFSRAFLITLIAEKVDHDSIQ